MHTHESTVRLMPDVASQAQPHLAGALDWVGMDGIEVPVWFDAGDGTAQRSSAQVGAGGRIAFGIGSRSLGEPFDTIELLAVEIDARQAVAAIGG